MFFSKIVLVIDILLYYNKHVIDNFISKSSFINEEDFIMAFVISDSCVACGACEAQCPVGAISMGDGKFEIDADKCISCGACAGQCPVGAIAEE